MVWHPDMDMRCGLLPTARLVYKALLLYCLYRHEEERATYDMTKMLKISGGDNYFIIFNSRDLVRDHQQDDEVVYIYATLMEARI